MKYQKIINLLDDTANQPSKSRTRNWVEIDNDSWGTYNVGNVIKFKTLITRSNLCEYSDENIHVKGNITVLNNGKI